MSGCRSRSHARLFSALGLARWVPLAHDIRRTVAPGINSRNRWYVARTLLRRGTEKEGKHVCTRERERADYSRQGRCTRRRCGHSCSDSLRINYSRFPLSGSYMAVHSLPHSFVRSLAYSRAWPRFSGRNAVKLVFARAGNRPGWPSV